jgi:hypothetical protein
MKKMSLSNRHMIVKCLFAIHFICLVICAFLLFTLRRSEHLRWGLGYIIVWGAILSALLLCFLINKQLKHWLLLKIYCVVFFLASATLGVVTQGLGVDTLFLPPKYCSDGDYLIRSRIDSEPIVNIVLLKNEGIIEKLIATYYYPTADSIKVYEDKGAIVIYCSKDNSYTDSLGCIEPLYNHLANENDIKALARELKVDIDRKSFQF